jgi:hypothetical protein
VVSGRLTVKMMTARKNRFPRATPTPFRPAMMPWVEGNESFVCIEVMSAEQYAKLQQAP